MLTKERALTTGKGYIGNNTLKTVVFKRKSTGHKVFAVFVAHANEVMDVTNYFCVATGTKLRDVGDRWEATANPGYDLDDWVNETWTEVSGR